MGSWKIWKRSGDAAAAAGAAKAPAQKLGSTESIQSSGTVGYSSSSSSANSSVGVCDLGATVPVGSERSLGDYECLGVIGKGATSTVYCARDTKTHSIVALKVVAKADLANGKLRKASVTRETRVMRTLAESGSADLSPFYTKLHDAFQTEEKVVMVMDFVPTGDLFKYVAEELPDRRLPEDAAKFVTAQLAVALQGMHTQGLVYRDVKMENILVDSELNVVLADFGLARATSDDNRCYTFAGTRRFIAPEVILGEAYGTACDWWSLGVLLFGLLTSKHPFPGVAAEEVMRSVVTREPAYYRHVGKTMTPTAADFISRLLTKDPKYRLQGEDVFRHPWFNDVDFFKIVDKTAERPASVTPPTRVYRPNKCGSFDQIVQADAAQALTREEQAMFADFDYVHAPHAVPVEC